ncbi:MAG: autotransporter outer membrane beta-barrel domain-containing protein [Desulfobulbus sp.]|nr:autotransporter outer membrane beta-barrel domain-containing protein [Desulfobulbus sp.]
MNDGNNHFAYINLSTGGELNLSNVAFTGGNRSGSGGSVIVATGDIIINGIGTLAFTNDSAPAGGSGGAIYTLGAVTITTDALLLTGNNIFTTGNAGAIQANANLTIDAGIITITDNHAYNSGAAAGAIQGNRTVEGSTLIGNADSIVTITGNSADGDTGAINGSTGVLIGNADSTVTVSGNSAVTSIGAIYSIGAVTIDGSQITIANNSAGTYAGAIYASSGSVTIDASRITIAGNSAGTLAGAIYGSTGVSIGNDGSIVTITGNSAGTSYAGAIYASSGAVTLTGSEITVANNSADTYAGAIGGGAGGANVSIGNVDGTSTVTVSGNSAGTTGGALYGMLGAVTINANHLTLSDNNAGQDGGAIYTPGDVTITTRASSSISNNTSGGDGGALWSGGTVSVNALGGEVSFANNTAGGLGGAIYLDPVALNLNAIGGDIVFVGNTAGGVANAVYIDNLAADPSTTVALNAAAGNAIIFYDPIANNTDNGLITVTKDGAGMVSFDGKDFVPGNFPDLNSAVYAGTTVKAGTFEVGNNAVYGAYIGTDPVNGTPMAGSSFTALAGTTVQGGSAGTIVADSMNIGGMLNIAGRQAWSTAAPGYSTFTLNANTVTFHSGSQVIFNTMLNDGSTQHSDLLVLDHGTATGTASVLVRNAGGLGGLTVGDGIRLVETENGATTAADTFVLGSRVAAGAYEYQLYRGGVAGDTPDDWYLRSADYRAEVPVYMAAPALANRMGLFMLGTYHDRVSEDRPDQWGADEGTQPGQNATGNRREMAGWGRVFGENGSAGYDKTASGLRSDGPSYDYGMGAIQVGVDLLRAKHGDSSRDIAGWYLGMMQGYADVEQVYSGNKAGRVYMDGYSFGGYWTHKGVSEWYIDVVLQGTRYADAEARSEGLAQSGKIQPNGWGVAASLEGGHPFALGNNWSLEPQAQIIYQWITLNDDNDQFGHVNFDDITAWYGRLGARLTKDWLRKDGRKRSVWARFNVWHAFGSDPGTSFSSLDGAAGTNLTTNLGGTWDQIGVGVAAEIAPHFTLFAMGDYNMSLSSAGGHALSGNLGLRYEF